MTSRERILNAINHVECDRVPLDIGATPSSSISAIAYNNLKKEIGMTTGHTRVCDVVQQLAVIEDEIIDRFGVDVINIGSAWNKTDNDWQPVTLADGSQAEWPSWFNYKKTDKAYEYYDEDGDKLAMMPNGATFFDQTCFPYIDDYPSDYSGLDNAMSKVLWKKLPQAPWDHASEADFYEKLRAKAIELRETTDKALLIDCGCNLFEWGTFLRRLDNFLMDIYTDPDLVEELLEQLLERHMQTLKKVCDSVGDVVDILKFGDDLGLDSATFFSREKYVDLFKPRHKIMTDYVHKNSSMKTMLHSCGSLYDIIPDIIEAGFDCLNPIQTTARNMEPEKLKKEFGKDICFWGGGCNTRSILNMGTPEEVYNYTRKVLDTWLPGGGYIFNQEHNIMPDVSGANILAMYKAVRDAK